VFLLQLPWPNDHEQMPLRQQQSAMPWLTACCAQKCARGSSLQVVDPVPCSTLQDHPEDMLLLQLLP
jgi:hypothetical protein